MNSTSKTLEIFPSKRKLFYWLAISGLFFIVSGWGIYDKFVHHDFDLYRFWISSVGFFLFMGCCLVVTILELIQRKPLLMINSEGITHHPTFGKSQFAEWEEIASIDIWSAGRGRLLVVSVGKTMDAFSSKNISLNADSFSMTAEEFLAIIRSHPNYKGNR